MSSVGSVGDAEGIPSGVADTSDPEGVPEEETVVESGVEVCLGVEHPVSMRMEIITTKIISAPVTFIEEPSFLFS
jgi:hypothetical protein